MIAPIHARALRAVDIHLDIRSLHQDLDIVWVPGNERLVRRELCRYQTLAIDAETDRAWTTAVCASAGIAGLQSDFPPLFGCVLEPHLRVASGNDRHTADEPKIDYRRDIERRIVERLVVDVEDARDHVAGGVVGMVGDERTIDADPPASRF